jgi:transcriptional regulator GlxA family with amidase domain
MARITFVLYEHCLSSAITAMIDAFSIYNSLYNHANTNGSGGGTSSSFFEMKIASVRLEPVQTNGGVWVQPDTTFESVKKSDLILIPPRLYGQLPKEGELFHIIPWLRKSYQKGVRIGAMCTGSFVLASTGLLDSKIATTNWQFVKKFQRQFPKVILKPDRILTEDEGLICSGAITAMYNLALYVFEIFGSKILSRQCSKILLVDQHRKSQLPYMATIFHKQHGDSQILNAQQWLEDNYASQFTIDDVANVVGLSPRHFKRRFKKATGETPLRYLQQMRLETAKNMLETSLENVEIITQQVGYEDSRTFRRLFKRFTSLSPREYRSRFCVI